MARFLQTRDRERRQRLKSRRLEQIGWRIICHGAKRHAQSEHLTDQDKYDQGIKYITSAGVKIESLSHNVLRNEERCTHCGACITICPTRAFILDPQTRTVSFDNNRCVACGLCIKACPPRAMELHF